MNLGLTRRNIGRLILLGWAVMLAWLARRQFSGAESTATAERTRRLEPGAQYFAVLAGGRQIGQLNLSADTLVDGVRLTEQFVLDLPVGDSTRQLVRGQQYYLSRSLRLKSFTRRVFGIGPAEQLDGTIGADSILSLIDMEGLSGTVGTARLRIEPEAILPGMLAVRTAFGGHLRVGERFSLPLIELGAGSTRLLNVRVAAESTFIVADSARWDSTAAQWVPATSDTIRAWRLEHDATGVPTRTWVDAGGAVLREESAGGLTLARSAFEIVGNNYRRARKAESSAWRRGIPGVRALLQAGRVPDTSAALRRFLWVAASWQASGPPERLLDGGRQSLRADTVSVWRDALEAGGEADSPPRSALGAAWELTDDREVRAVARTVLRGAPSRLDSARALTRWVSREVAVDLAPTAVGSALAALRARRAGPDGKARLLASLARASGLPARAVSGVAVFPDGVFAHAWTELWLDRWVAADPSTGQLPASASLIRLSVGERSRPIELLPLVGSARFLPLRPAR